MFKLKVEFFEFTLLILLMAFLLGIVAVIYDIKVLITPIQIIWIIVIMYLLWKFYK